jgi:class 3 adenylate cyclase
MTRAVFEQRGTVDKFIGDAIMALFGAPEELSVQEQAQRAIATARAMYRYLEELNQSWQKRGILGVCNFPRLQLRCGIHQGKAVVGMFGGGQRKDYTAIGKAVNIASRLQEAAFPNSILISATVAACLENQKEIKAIKPLQLKGIETKVMAYSLIV